MSEANEPLCCISYQPEAHESAANAFASLQGWTLRVVPAKGEPFDAIAADLIFDRNTGHAMAVLHPWPDGAEEADSSKAITMDIYDDIKRVEVI